MEIVNDILSKLWSLVKASNGVLPRLAEKNEIFGYVDSAFLIIASFFFLAVAVMVFSYPLRFMWHRFYRRWRIGDMVWNEIEAEGAVSEETMPNASALMSSASHITPPMTARYHMYGARPVVSFIIRKDADEGNVRMFLGVSKNVYENSGVKAWASSMNCIATEVDFDEIGFIPNSPSIARRTRFQASDFTKVPERKSIGSVNSAVQTAMDTSDSGSTLIVSYEPMRQSEIDMTGDHIFKQEAKAMGDKSMFSKSKTTYGDFAASNPSRGVIAAFSDNGGYRHSKAILNSAINGIPNLGVNAVSDKASDILRNKMISWGALVTFIGLFLASYFSSVPLAVVIVAAALWCAGVSGLPILSDQWVSFSAKDGTMDIPVFWRYSIRRMLAQAWAKNSRTDYTSDEGGRNEDKYIAAPSCDEIIPLYQTSVMQITSIPVSGYGSTNIARSTIPQVAIPSSVLKGIGGKIKSKEVVYMGMSARSNSPVFVTLKDAASGLAVGGKRGSGKTNFLQDKFLEMAYLSRSDMVTRDGGSMTPIWFETKPDDVAALSRMASDFNSLYVPIHDSSAPARLCLEGPRMGDGISVKKIENNISRFVSMVNAVWGESNIGPNGRSTLTAAMTAAMLMRKSNKAILKQVDAISERSKNNGRGSLSVKNKMEASALLASTLDGLRYMQIEDKFEHPDRPNIMEVIRVLAGCDDSIEIDKKIVRYNKYIKQILQKDVISKLQGEGESAPSKAQKELLKTVKILSGALDSLIFLHGDDRTTSIRSKLNALATSKGLFETYTEDGERREEYGLERFITYYGPVIIDMTSQNSPINDNDIRRFTMGIHYMTWQWIQNNCGGWAAQNKYTLLFADEITNFVGTDQDQSECGDIIAKVSDLGRSFGASHNVGYQSLNQMDKNAARTLLGFDNHMMLNMIEESTQDLFMGRVEKSGGQFTAENLKYLPQGIAIADLSINGEQVPPFTIKTPYVGDFSAALKKAGTIPGAFKLIEKHEKEDMKKKRKKVNVTVVDEDYENMIKREDEDDAYIIPDHQDIPDNW